MKTGYLAKEGLERELERELKRVMKQYGRLFIAEGAPQNVYFVQDIWHDPEEITFSSISEAAGKLKQRQKLWAHVPYQNIRRAGLIQEKLAYFQPKPVKFPSILPTSQLGSWSLIDMNTLIASSHSMSPFAQGEVRFEETKTPPSRAYLKLWEFFTRTQQMPKAGECCLELGASPGSWTWVLQSLGTNVIAVDRAPLDPKIEKLPLVTSMQKDAFSLKPEDYHQVDWVFSDLICTPDKLYAFVREWMEVKPTVNFVCTLKFQGDADFGIIEKFAAIKGSKICHLFHNKHELTWWNLPQATSQYQEPEA